MANTTEKKTEPNTLAKETKVLENKTTEKPAKKETKEKKSRAPRARKVEELINEATKNMTDKEKDVLIKYMREEVNKMKNQFEALKNNLDAAYAKVNQIEKGYNDMEKFYRDNLAYIDNQAVAFFNAIRKSTMGGAN